MPVRATSFITSAALSVRQGQAKRGHYQNACRRSVRRRRRVSCGTSAAMSGAKGSGVLFVVRGTDADGIGEKRRETREAHLKWAVSEDVDMEFGGPLRASDDPTMPVEGSLLIVRAASRADVDARLARDPYVRASVFGATEVLQWTCGMRSQAPLPRQLFMVWCVDRAGARELRARTRPRHLDWWRAAERQGLIGPFVRDGQPVGTLILCSGGGLEEVRAWAQTDPYFLADLFESVDVRAVTKVIEQGALALEK